MTVKGLRLTASSAILSVMIFTAHAQAVAVLATNYELEFTVNGQSYSVQSRARVRSGNEIPIELQNYKVGLRIAESSTEEFSLEINIYEKSGGGWYLINTPAPEFQGKLGVPTELAWKSGDLKVDVAIIVGIQIQ